MELEELKELNFSKFPTLSENDIQRTRLLVNAFFYLNSKQSSVLEQLTNLIYSAQLSQEDKNKFMIVFGELLEGRNQFNESFCYFLEHITKRD